jgi:virulence factor Mce-like protein
MSPLAPSKKPVGRKKGMPALAIAAIVIIVPLLVTYYAFERHFPFLNSQYTDYAIVPNSVNVRSGSPVRIAGIDVGEVTGVSAARHGTKVAFALDSTALPLHTDATVTIRDRLFLEGGYYLALEPGSPNAPVAPQGFTIQRQDTQTPVQFFQVLSTFDLAARANLEQLLNTANAAFSQLPGLPITDSGAYGLKTAIPQLTPILKDISWISKGLSGTRPGDAEKLLDSASVITGTLSDNVNQLVGLITSLNQTSTALASEDDALGSTIVNLNETLQQAPATLTSLNRSLNPLSNLADALTPALRQSPALVSQLSSEISAVYNVIKPGERGPLLRSLRTLLASFPQALTEFGSVFPVTKEVAECLATRITPVLKDDINDGALTTGYPVWKEILHMLPTLASASGDYDGNGHYLRVLLGLGSDSLPSGTLGDLPGVGPLVGTVAGADGNTTIQGIAPHWVGDLSPAVFRPDVPCVSQPLMTDLGPTP